MNGLSPVTYSIVFAANAGGMTIAVGAAGAAGASVSAPRAPSVAATNPYSPAYHHAYRQGAVPTKSQLGKMRGWLSSHLLKRNFTLDRSRKIALFVSAAIMPTVDANLPPIWDCATLFACW